MSGLSETSLSAAFRSNNGECAWRAPDVTLAVSELAASGHAILGGEVWLVIGREIHATVPISGNDEMRAVVHWESTSRAPTEPWPAFVARTESDSRAAIQSILRVSIPASVPQEQVHFNLTWVTEPEYAALGAG